MTQNQLIEQIVEVLKKHGMQPFYETPTTALFDSEFEAAATEIAALHPLTKLREDVERLREKFSAEWNKRKKMNWENEYVEQSGCLNEEDCLQLVLSLLPQENDGNASEILQLLSDLIKWEETNFIEPDLLARVKDVKAKLERTLPSPPKSK